MVNSSPSCRRTSPLCNWSVTDIALSPRGAARATPPGRHEEARTESFAACASMQMLFRSGLRNAAHIVIQQVVRMHAETAQNRPTCPPGPRPRTCLLTKPPQPATRHGPTRPAYAPAPRLSPAPQRLGPHRPPPDAHFLLSHFLTFTLSHFRTFPLPLLAGHAQQESQRDGQQRRNEHPPLRRHGKREGVRRDPERQSGRQKAQRKARVGAVRK